MLVTKEDIFLLSVLAVWQLMLGDHCVTIAAHLGSTCIDKLSSFHKMTQRLCICLVIPTRYNSWYTEQRQYMYLYIKSNISFLSQLSRVLVDWAGMCPAYTYCTIHSKVSMWDTCPSCVGIRSPPVSSLRCITGGLFNRNTALSFTAIVWTMCTMCTISISVLFGDLVKRIRRLQSTSLTSCSLQAPPQPSHSRSYRQQTQVDR